MNRKTRKRKRNKKGQFAPTIDKISGMTVKEKEPTFKDDKGEINPIFSRLPPVEPMSEPRKPWWRFW